MSSPQSFSLVSKFFKAFWNLFLSGLIALLPISITIVIFNLAFSILNGWLAPLQQFRPAFLKAIPHSEFLLIITAIFLVGVLLRSLIFHPILHAVERAIARIPLVRPVYQGVKQLVSAFGTQGKPGFKKVVLTEFPRPGVYSIGFVTSEVSQGLTPKTNDNYVSVFIPTTPNPTTGYLILLPESQITTLTLTPQEAMALIISGGIIQPPAVKEQAEIGQ